MATHNPNTPASKDEESIEQKRMKREAYRFAHLSHELRSPLNAIIGFTELLHLEKIGPVTPEQKEYLGDILTSSQHLLQIINDLLKQTKDESPTENIPTVTDIPRDHLKLQNTSPTILVIEDDPTENALISKTLSDVGYSVEVAFNGTVAMRLCQEKKYDVILLDLLLPDTTGWDVLSSYRSKGPNIDTTTIVVTIVGSEAASFGFKIQNFLIKPIKYVELIAALQQSSVNPNENKTILFVDDDPHMLMICKHYMKDFGATIHCETIPEKALELAKNNRPDVVVLDLLMPSMDGLEFLRLLRKNQFGVQIPVIICTSQDLSEIDRSRIKASVAAVIQKDGESMKNLVAEMHRVCPITIKDK